METIGFRKQQRIIALDLIVYEDSDESCSGQTLSRAPRGASTMRGAFRDSDEHSAHGASPRLNGAYKIKLKLHSNLLTRHSQF